MADCIAVSHVERIVPVSRVNEPYSQTAMMAWI
jgi:hypothetical protein